jgi:hypothetical protein
VRLCVKEERGPFASFEVTNFLHIPEFENKHVRVSFNTQVCSYLSDEKVSEVKYV